MLIKQADELFQVGCAVLHYAAGGGYVDLVVKLIEKGANINQADTTHTAMFYLTTIRHKCIAV
jgi:ankyrin repeat protein